MKKYLLWIVVCLLMLAGCGGPSGETASNLISLEGSALAEDESDFEMPERPEPVKHTLDEPAAAIDYIYDVDDPAQAAYYHDNVFTAVITEIGAVYDPYWEPEYVQKYGALPVYDPCYTKYQLRVTQSIKGPLREGDIITADRCGYYDEDAQAYLASEDPVVPEVGVEYLCLARQGEDGIYGLSTPRTLIPLPEDGADSTGQTRQEIIDRYTEACKNAVACPSVITSQEPFDYITLYVDVLETLWKTGSEKDDLICCYLCVDLSDAPGDLSQEEKDAIAKTFAQTHGARAVLLTYDELMEQEYFIEPGDIDLGMMLSIEACPQNGPKADSAMEGPWEEVRFAVRKWSSLGSCRYEDCTADWYGDGTCVEYQIGPEKAS